MQLPSQLQGKCERNQVFNSVDPEGNVITPSMHWATGGINRRAGENWIGLEHLQMYLHGEEASLSLFQLSKRHDLQEYQLDVNT